jgi:hypothetical protein
MKGDLMKKILVIMLLTLATNSFAWEIENNPDRYPSLALGFDSGTLDGDGFVSAALSNNASGQTGTMNDLDVQTVSPSLRVPLATNLTIDLRATFYDYNYKSQGDKGTLFRHDYNLKGATYGGTLRIYLK